MHTDTSHPSAYDFDQVVDRTGTGSVKVDDLLTHWGREDLIPLWVADMDFETAPFITQALQRRLTHSLFGYTRLPDAYWPTVIRWIEDHHQWKVSEEWLLFIPGIVKGIGMAINVFCKPGDKVIVQPPVYHPFFLLPQANGREVVYNPLILREDGYYDMDFEQLARVADEKCRLLLLCNPHNPAGLCWDRPTLERLAHFCASRGIVVISDEIHCDMALFGHRHIPFATVSEEAARCSITFSSPSKTFNMAGLVSSWAVVPDERLRQTFFSWVQGNELDHSTLFAPIATMAAFREGEEWRRQMLAYVEGNVDFVIGFCEKYIPRIKPLRPQASFLVWLNCRDLKLSHEALIDLFVDKARLALNDGEMFGSGGEGFMRLNVATPHSVLREAFTRLREAVDTLPGQNG